MDSVSRGRAHSLPESFSPAPKLDTKQDHSDQVGMLGTGAIQAVPPKPLNPIGGQTKTQQPITLQPAKPVDVSVANDRAIREVQHMQESAQTFRTMGLHRAAAAIDHQLNCINQTFERLSSGPMIADAMSGRIEDLNQQIEELNQGISQARKCQELVSNNPQLLEKLETLSSALVTALDRRVSYLQGCIDTNPLSRGELIKGKAVYASAAKLVLQQQLDKGDLKPEQKAELMNALLMMDRREKQLQQAASGSRAKEIVNDPEKILGKKKIKGKHVAKSAAKGSIVPVLGTTIFGIMKYLKLRKQSKVLSQHATALQNGQPFPVETPTISEQHIITKALKATFKKAGLDPQHVKHALHEGVVEHLNNQTWDIVSNTILLKSGKAQVELTSTITPAAHFKSSELRHQYDGKGVCSHAIHEGRHATALAHTELRDASGEQLFSALRHGVNSAFGFTPDGVADMSNEQLGKLARPLLPQFGGKPSAEARLPDAQLGAITRVHLLDTVRAQANKNRAMEIVQSAIVTDPAKLAQAARGEPITVSINSISLLTPDFWRSGTSSERMMVQDQMKAWDAVEGEQTMLINGQRVRVKVEVAAFNFGVNAGGVGTGSHTIAHYKETQLRNDKAMTRLIGDFSEVAKGNSMGGKVHKYLDQLNQELQGLVDSRKNSTKQAEISDLTRKIRQLELRIQQVTTLARQIAEIYTSGAYLDAGTEPYKLVSRLAVLSHMIGDTTTFNCKSGKDRTGELDAEAKMLAWQIANTGRVPDYDRAQYSKEEQGQFQAMATRCGSHEVQKQNTGFAGYKLSTNWIFKKAHDALYLRFGGSSQSDGVFGLRRGPGQEQRDALRQQFTGASGATAS